LIGGAFLRDQPTSPVDSQDRDWEGTTFWVGFGLGFCVRFDHDDRGGKDAPIGEYGWGSVASRHYWISPKHGPVVTAMEQPMPHNWNMEKALKPLMDAAVEKSEKE
jgi:CubicO group peptidase (beta-lactamase class C family)